MLCESHSMVWCNSTLLLWREEIQQGSKWTDYFLIGLYLSEHHVKWHSFIHFSDFLHTGKSSVKKSSSEWDGNNRKKKRKQHFFSHLVLKGNNIKRQMMVNWQDVFQYGFSTCKNTECGLSITSVMEVITPPPQFHWLEVYRVYPKLYWQAIETAPPDDAAHLKSNSFPPLSIWENTLWDKP